MIYYTTEARMSAIHRIMDLIQKIGEIPGNILSYHDAMSVTWFLIILMEEIEKEDKHANERKMVRK